MSEEPADSGGSGRGAELDALFSALADERRRQVLRYFEASESDVAPVDALADSLGERGATAEDRKRIAIRLHHFTLPKLADLVFADYDARTRTVRYHGTPKLERVLNAVSGIETTA